jgi:protein gp37
MGETSIEWTDATWNPVRGCARVSPGCENCYAEGQAHRFSGPGQPYEGLTVLGKHGPRWAGRARFVPEMLDRPLRWRRPRRVFVNSMSDLFHEDVTNEQIAAVFGVMAACPQHTFQVLTKRPGRALEWFGWVEREAQPTPDGVPNPHEDVMCGIMAANRGADVDYLGLPGLWPLPNVWLGVSVEDQQRADERIPLLLQCPAAVRFLSCEPLLGPVELGEMRYPADDIGWVIVGGESGPGARPCRVEWIRSVLAQCRAAGVPAFCKQLGARPIETLGEVEIGDCKADLGEVEIQLIDRKGGDPAEWPEDLRIREWPQSTQERMR